MKIKKALAAGTVIMSVMIAAIPGGMTAFAYTGDGSTLNENKEDVWVFDTSSLEEDEQNNRTELEVEERDYVNNGNDVESQKEEKEFVMQASEPEAGEDIIKIDAPDGYEPTHEYSVAGILTPEGNLSLVDDIDEEEAKELLEYMTVTTKDGSYFYIIVDKSGMEKNVHFLNAVDASDLMAIMSDDEKEKYADLIEETQKEEPVLIDDEKEQEEAKEETAEKKKTASNPFAMLTVFLIIGAAVAGGYYFIRIKPGRQTRELDEDVEFEDDEEYMADEESFINEDDEDDADGYAEELTEE